MKIIISLIYAMKTALWYGRILRWDALSILNAAHLHKHWKKRPFPLYASYAIIHHSFYGQEIMKTIVNWHARMASSAVWWDWGVTPAQQSDRISISVSGKAARSTMALLMTQMSVQ